MAKFSIILPVRNGGEYVKLCVSSILGQQYGDLELLVLDNCSTDGTADWLRSLNDPRVKIFPADSPLSIEENWKRALTVPKSEFMTLIGHDDVLAPHFLQTMNDLIEDHQEASLYQAHFNYIDANGKLIRHCHPMEGKETADSFLRHFLDNRIDVMGTGFMMRSADYVALGGIPPYPNLLFADFEIWIKLAKLGYLAIAKEECFSFRLHQSMTTRSGDEKFFSAYERFIHFLAALAKEKEEFAKVIRSSGPRFLLFYCRGLSHRLLRTPWAERKGMTVNKVISKTKEFAGILNIGSIDPESVFSIRLAKWIDKFSLTRLAFLGFKSIFKKPVLK